jgi:hypothetical protein
MMAHGFALISLKAAPDELRPPLLCQRSGAYKKPVRYRYTALQWGGPWPANLDRKMTFYFPRDWCLFARRG